MTGDRAAGVGFRDARLPTEEANQGAVDVPFRQWSAPVGEQVVGGLRRLGIDDGRLLGRTFSHASIASPTLRSTGLVEEGAGRGEMVGFGLLGQCPWLPRAAR